MFYLTGCGRGTFSHRIFDCHCGCCGPFAHHFVGRYHTFGHEMSKKSCQTSESRCYWIWETSQIKKWWRFEQYRYYNCYSGKCCLFQLSLRNIRDHYRYLKTWHHQYIVCTFTNIGSSLQNESSESWKILKTLFISLAK